MGLFDIPQISLQQYENSKITKVQPKMEVVNKVIDKHIF